MCVLNAVMTSGVFVYLEPYSGCGDLLSDLDGLLFRIYWCIMISLIAVFLTVLQYITVDYYRLQLQLITIASIFWAFCVGGEPHSTYITLFPYRTSVISPCLTGLLSLSLFHSLGPSKLPYKSVTISIPLKTKIANFKQIYSIYHLSTVWWEWHCEILQAE
jgi:hypothetical protein